MTRAETYAAQLTTLNEEISRTIASCTEADWQRVCADEERTVGVVTHHMVTVEGVIADALRGLNSVGYTAPNLSAEAIDRVNAQHAAAFTEVGRDETLALLRTNGAALTTALTALDDAQLDQVAGVFGGHELRVAQVVELALIAHFQGHLATIHATVAA